MRLIAVCETLSFVSSLACWKTTDIIFRFENHAHRHYELYMQEDDYTLDTCDFKSDLVLIGFRTVY